MIELGIILVRFIGDIVFHWSRNLSSLVGGGHAQRKCVMFIVIVYPIKINDQWIILLVLRDQMHKRGTSFMTLELVSFTCERSRVESTPKLYRMDERHIVIKCQVAS